MNASFLLLSTAWMAGADAPPPAPAPAPVVMAAPAAGPVIGGCLSCGSCDPCGAGIKPGCADPNPEAKEPGLFGKLKGKLGGMKHGCGACGGAAGAHSCATPLFTGFTTAGCDTCGGHSGPGLLAKLKAKFGSKGECCAEPACDTCASAGHPVPTVGGCALPPIPAHTAAAPVVTMPATPVVPAPVVTTPAPKPVPVPMPMPIPAVPKATVPPVSVAPSGVTPVSGPTPLLTGTRNPF